MSFDHPQGLWLLALAAPILAVHFYRGRIRRIPVPTLFFWEQIIIEEERKSALKKLRHYASLFLNLIALMTLTSAVASPNVKGVTRPPMKVALVIDTSPAMMAREKDGRTRLDRAVDGARLWLDRLAPADEVSLYDARGLRETLTRDRDRVRRALQALEVTPGVRAEDVAATLRATRSDFTVVLYDERIGTSLENRAWISGFLRRAPGDRYYTLVAEANAPARIVVRFDGETIDERESAALLVLPLDSAKYPGRKLERGGVLQVGFAEPDALALDDTATFILPPVTPRPVMVYCVDRPDPFLVAALSALQAEGRVVHGSAKIGAFMPGPAAIFDRCAPPEPLAPGAYLILGAPGKSVERPVVSDWDRRARLTSGVDFTDLAVKRARILGGDHVFLESAQGPLGVTRGRGGTAVAELGFAVDESDLGLRPAFPLFLRNWVDWIDIEGLRAFPAEVSFGAAISPGQPLWIADGVLRVRTVASERSVTVKAGRPAEPIRASLPGVVRLSAGDRSEWVAVNFFDAAESDLRVPEPVSPPAPPHIPWVRKIPYAVVAALIVLALLLLEWYLFHRGII